jgi:hypothetical protein
MASDNPMISMDTWGHTSGPFEGCPGDRFEVHTRSACAAGLSETVLQTSCIDFFPLNAAVAKFDVGASLGAETALGPTSGPGPPLDAGIARPI